MLYLRELKDFNFCNVAEFHSDLQFRIILFVNTVEKFLALTLLLCILRQ